MTTRVFTSAMNGAPVKDDTSATSINDILDKVLVEGFGTQVLTSLTQVAGVATAVCTTPHGFEFSTCRVGISGCVEVDYNGDHQITVVDGSTFTFPVQNDPVTPATTVTSIEMTITPAGWSKAFEVGGTGINERMYKQGGGNGFYLKSFGSASGNSTGLRGFKKASSIDVGEGGFPSIQAPSMDEDDDLHGRFGMIYSSGLSPYKWIIVADETFIYFHAQSSNDVTRSGTFYFGDFDKESEGQVDNCVLNTRRSSNFSYLSHCFGFLNQNSTKNMTCTPSSGRVGINDIARECVVRLDDDVVTISGKIDNESLSRVPYPHPLTGKLHLTKFILGSGESRGHKIGTFKRVYGSHQKLNFSTFAHKSEIIGNGNLNGKHFIVLHCYDDTLSFVDISN